MLPCRMGSLFRFLESGYYNVLEGTCTDNTTGFIKIDASTVADLAP